MKKNKEKQSKGKFILVFGILSAVIAVFFLLAGIDFVDERTGYSIPVFMVCVSVLFSLFSVMINRIGLRNGRWITALLCTSAAEAAAQIIFLILSGDNIRTSEIVICVVTAVSAAALFLMKDKIRQKQDSFIPLGLGIIASAAGMLTLNIMAYRIFKIGLFVNMWIGIALAVLFLILSMDLTKKALGPEQRNKAFFLTFVTADAVQAAGLLYAVLYEHMDPLYIFQGCMLAALSAAAIVFYIKIRKSMTPGRKTKTK